MTLVRLFAALLFAFIAVPAAAQGVAQAAPQSQVVASASSPSGTLKVEVTLNPDGRLGYQVLRGTRLRLWATRCCRRPRRCATAWRSAPSLLTY